MLSGAMPGGLSQDVATIAQNESPGFNIEMLPYTGLMAYGGAPWGSTRPSSFASQDPTSTKATSTFHGVTSTLSDTSSVTASSSGSSSGSGSGSSGGGYGSGSGGSGGGSWDQSYDNKTSRTISTTGTDDAGLGVNQQTSQTYELVWHAWGDGGGVTNYSVKQDVTYSYTNGSTAPNGGAYSVQTGEFHDSHLTADGKDDGQGKVSGKFSLQADVGTTFALNDSSGSPQSSAPGYSVNYIASRSATLNESGGLADGSTGKGTVAVTSAENGDISNDDGQGNFDGVSRGDGDTVTSDYDGSQGPTGATPTTGTVSAGGQRTQLQVPQGKNKVTVIDTGDHGWMDWTQKQRDDYSAKKGWGPGNPAPAGGTVATAANLTKNLTPGGGQIIGGYGVAQVVNDLGTVVALTGQADVLVIGDHGNSTNGQQLGKEYLLPTIGSGPNTLDPIVGAIKNGGTLVLAGCSVFGPDPYNNNQSNIGLWQTYADNHHITIIGSAASVGFPNDGSPVTGVWITLVPGGTAPTINP